MIVIPYSALISVRLRQAGRFNNVQGFFSCLSGAEFYGYEVHMGITEDTQPNSRPAAEVQTAVQSAVTFTAYLTVLMFQEG